MAERTGRWQAQWWRRDPVKVQLEDRECTACHYFSAGITWCRLLQLKVSGEPVCKGREFCVGLPTTEDRGERSVPAPLATTKHRPGTS
jgi:hypothetical protein